MPKDNLETVRAVIAAYMTPDSPLVQVLEPLMDELALLRAGINAVSERVDSIDGLLTAEEAA